MCRKAGASIHARDNLAPLIKRAAIDSQLDLFDETASIQVRPQCTGGPELLGCPGPKCTRAYFSNIFFEAKPSLKNHTKPSANLLSSGCVSDFERAA